MIKIVKSRKAKIPVEYYLHEMHKKAEQKYVEQLMLDPDNTNGINPEHLTKYLSMAKRELKKQEIKEKESKRSL